MTHNIVTDEMLRIEKMRRQVNEHLHAIRGLDQDIETVQEVLKTETDPQALEELEESLMDLRLDRACRESMLIGVNDELGLALCKTAHDDLMYGGSE